MAATFQDIPPGALAPVAAGTVPGKVPGDRKWKLIRITADANYLTGGYALTPANFGFGTQIDFVILANDGTGNTGTTGALNWVWNTQTQKMQLFTSSTGAELGNGQTAAGCFMDIIGVGF